MNFRLLADENLDIAIVLGLKRLIPDIDIFTVHEVGLQGLSDPEILEWAAQNDRVLITHDVNTMIGILHQRVESGLASPGIIAVQKLAPIGRSIADLHVMLEASTADELKNSVSYIPID